MNRTALVGRVEKRVQITLGGSAKARIVVLLAATQALDSMDRGSLGALAPSLEASLHFSNTGLGFLLAVVSATSAVAALGAGVLIDRYNRTRILAGSLTLWTLAMAAGALAQSFTFLLISRIALGLVIATVGPASASLTGDLYPADERGRILGWIRSGELGGLGIAYIIVGAVTWMLSWRAVFVVLAVSGAVVAGHMWQVREPRRTSGRAAGKADHHQVENLARQKGARPGTDGVVLHRRAQSMPLVQVIRYALSIRTNRWLLVAEAVGDFALSGVATFAVLFATEQYDTSQSMAALLYPLAGSGALVGILLGGRLGDRLIRVHHILPARLWVAGVGYLIAAITVIPALLAHSISSALPFLIVAAAGLGASYPSVSAARLDVVVGALWGRVEAIRTLLRTAATAGAPLLGGFLSDHLLGGGRAGLQMTIFLLLPFLAANGVLVLFTSRTYPSDVAAVAASNRRS